MSIEAITSPWRFRWNCHHDALKPDTWSARAGQIPMFAGKHEGKVR